MNFTDYAPPCSDSVATIYTIAIPFLTLRNLPMSQSRRNALTAISIIALRFVAFVEGISNLLTWDSVMGAGIARTAFLFKLAHSPNGDATCKSVRPGTRVAILYAGSSHLLHAYATRPHKQRPLSSKFI
jgi:hypothetical protein